MPELEKHLSHIKKLVESELDRVISFKASPKLCEAMRYSLFSKGKRIRPALTLAACKALKGQEKAALPYACAIELIHTYSLIHDDLPCMDDDDMRREKPANHKEFGEALAVLAGDALLTAAFETASRENEAVDERLQLKIINLIAKASGAEGMVGGQELDMEAEGKDTPLDDLKKIHLHKTGKLIQCAILVGAIAAAASEKELLSLGNYGKNIGLAFQITDDILDFTGKLPGKNPKGDIRNNKSTFATLLGEEESRKMVVELTNEAVDLLKEFDEKADLLRDMARMIKKRII